MKTNHYLASALLAATILWGCGGSGTTAPIVETPEVPAPVEKIEISRVGESNGNRYFTDQHGNKLFGGKTYYNAHTFWKGFCIVSQMVDGKELRGVINAKGEEVVPCTHTESMENFDNGYFKISNPKVGYMDTTGKVVIPMEYTKSLGVTNGMVKLEKNYKKWGLLRMNGEEIIPFEYETIGSWNNGLARVEKAGKKWGYVNEKGELAIPMEYSDATNFSQGVALVAKGKKYALIDTAGTPITDFLFDNYEYIVDVEKNDYSSTGYSESNKRLVMEEGYIIVSKGGLWGYIDKSGKEVIPCKYDNIYVMDRSGSVTIRKDDKRGSYDIKTQTEKWY